MRSNNSTKPKYIITVYTAHRVENIVTERLCLGILDYWVVT